MGYYNLEKTCLALLYRAERVGGQCNVPYTACLGIASTEDGKIVFGLTSEFGREMTHMGFTLDKYFEVETVVRTTRERGGWFHFDAGSSCPEIKISADWLEQAFKSLGLLDANGKGVKKKPSPFAVLATRFGLSRDKLINDLTMDWVDPDDELHVIVSEGNGNYFVSQVTCRSGRTIIDLAKFPDKLQTFAEDRSDNQQKPA